MRKRRVADDFSLWYRQMTAQVVSDAGIQLAVQELAQDPTHYAAYRARIEAAITAGHIADYSAIGGVNWPAYYVALFAQVDALLAKTKEQGK